MTKPQRAIGIFQNSLDTEAALKKLDNSHYSLERVFVIARDRDKEREIVATQLCESLRQRFDAKITSVARQDTSSDRDNTTINLTHALIELDIPADTARLYEELVANHKYLIMVEGDRADIAGAERVLQGCGVNEWVSYEVIREHPDVIVVDRRHLNL